MFKRFIERKFGIVTFAMAGVLIIPQLYFLSNLEGFNKDISLPLIAILAAFCVVVFGSCLPIKTKGQYIFCGLGLSILLCDQFLRVGIAHLDGSENKIFINPVKATINTLIYFGLPIILLVLGEKLRKILTDLTFILVFAGVGISAYSLYSSWPERHTDDIIVSSPNDKNQTEKSRPNVYFIWLDAMETEYMERYIEKGNHQSSFEGFSLFTNNSSNYLYTLQSYASFMSGTIFKGGLYSQWADNGDQLRQDLKSLDYNITTYAKNGFVSTLDDITHRASDIFQQKSKIKHPFIQDFISYSIVRVLPSAIANQSLNIGRSIGSYASAMLNHKSTFAKVTSIADGIEPLSGIFILEKLIADEQLRKKNNEFVIAQAIIPHGPYVIDRNCGYRGKSDNPFYENYFEQVECSVGLVQKFFAHLKSMNRYHSSIIVIMGDHGSGWASLIEGLKDGEPGLNPQYTPWSKDMVISRASALLMIKPSNTTENTLLKMQTKESQLVDIYPTLLNMLGAEDKVANNVDGIDLYSNDKVNREKYITYFKPDLTLNPYIAETYDLEFDAQNKSLYYRSPLLTENDLPELKCNELIDFSSVDLASSNYISTGLSAIEGWGRWSNEESVTVKLKLPKMACKQKSMTVILKGFVTPKHSRQRSVVTLNGERIGKFEINEGEPSPTILTFDLPPSTYLPGQVNNIEFSVGNSISPKELGVNNDTRRIGLWFESISFQ
jgi:hypothetical protein